MPCKLCLIVVVLFSFSYLSCKDQPKKSSKDKITLSFKKEGTLQLKKALSDSIITTIDIEIADNDYDTQTGLMYRNVLDKDQGMLFIFPNEDYRSFYMKNTKIALDIIYMDSNQTIVSFQKNAKPLDETSLPSSAPAKYVLEVNAGLVDDWQLQVGDTMMFSVE